MVNQNVFKSFFNVNGSLIFLCCPHKTLTNLHFPSKLASVDTCQLRIHSYCFLKLWDQRESLFPCFLLVECVALPGFLWCRVKLYTAKKPCQNFSDSDVDNGCNRPIYHGVGNFRHGFFAVQVNRKTASVTLTRIPKDRGEIRQCWNDEITSLPRFIKHLRRATLATVGDR